MSISRKNFLRGSALAAGALVLSKKSVAEETKAATAAAKPPPGPPPPNAVHFPVLKPSEFDEMLKWLRSAFELQKPPDPTAIDELIKKVQEKKAEIVEK